MHLLIFNSAHQFRRNAFIRLYTLQNMTGKLYMSSKHTFFSFAFLLFFLSLKWLHCRLSKSVELSWQIFHIHVVTFHKIFSSLFSLLVLHLLNCEKGNDKYYMVNIDTPATHTSLSSVVYNNNNIPRDNLFPCMLYQMMVINTLDGWLAWRSVGSEQFLRYQFWQQSMHAGSLLFF